MTVSFIATLLIATCSDGRSIAQEQRISSVSEPLKVVSWNIHGCSSGIEGVIKQLRRLHPDLMCLQEAEASEDQAGVRQPQAIAKVLGMREYSAGSRLPNGHEQRMAILFHGQIAKPEPLNAGTGRIYGVTGLIRLNGAEIRVVCLHLTSSYRTEIRHLLKTTAARSEESKHLVKLLGQWSTPVIVAGDFNSMSGMLDHDAITGRLRATPTTRPTFPSDHPLLAIDHIYVSPPLRILSLATRPTVASDHVPVVALIVRAADPGPPVESAPSQEAQTVSSPGSDPASATSLGD